MRTVLIALAVVAVLWLLVVAVFLVVARGAVGREVVQLLPNLARLFRDLMKDPRVPRSSKVLLGGAMLWLVSPVDLIPEFIPILGPVDDVVVAGLALRHLVRRAGSDVIRELWQGDERTLRVVFWAARIRF